MGRFRKSVLSFTWAVMLLILLQSAFFFDVIECKVPPKTTSTGQQLFALQTTKE